MSIVRSIFKKGLFANKVAIVTGGGSGIGEGIAKEIANLGATVLICSRNTERLKNAVGRIAKAAGCSQEKVSYFQVNIRKEQEVQNMIKECLKRYGALDFLVNNGGGQYQAPAHELTYNGWHAVVDLNLIGTFMCTREAYTQWMSKHGGSIINITVDNRNGLPLMCHSGAARAGVENMTRTLALEWAHTGIRLNVLVPGSIVYSQKSMSHYGEAGSKMFTSARLANPSKRWGTNEEMAAAACFLLSPAAAWINGITLHVGGGGHLVGNPFYKLPDHNASKPFTWDEPDQVEKRSDS